MEELQEIYGYTSKDCNFSAVCKYTEMVDNVVDAPLTMHRVEPEKWWNEEFTGSMAELDSYVRTKEIELNNG